MANSKKRLLTVLSVLVAMCIMMFTLAACGTDSVVKFMVQDVNGEWKVQAEEVVEDGVVNAPTAPEKEYYTFAGWYLDKEGTNEFKIEEIKEDVEVYARYNPVQVNITFNREVVGKKNLVDVVNETYKPEPAEGLEFDGWYKDADCTEGNKWDGKETVNELYAKSVAVLTFNNGYENLYTVKVDAGAVFADPAEQKVTVDEVETTLEASILKDYMSDRNLDYVDAEGNLIDFTKKVEKSATITVLWNSKIDDSQYKLNEKTGNYYLQPSSLPDAPAISLRSDITIMVKEGETEVAKNINVESIEAYATMGLIKPSVKKIIFGEGFKSIKGISGDGACLVEEVVIPSTTKIVDGSFNNMPKLQSLSLPDGVEVVIGSLMKKVAGDRRSFYQGEAYDFDINVPASVKNLSVVPNNLVFAEGSAFYKDNGYIYQDTEKGKVLICDPNAVAGSGVLGVPVADTIVVPDGVVGIQVGTYSTAFNYLMFPASFKFVQYNVNLADYPFYVFSEGSFFSNSTNMLYDAAAKDAPATTMNQYAFAITANLGGFVTLGPGWTPIYHYSGKVVFPSETVPAELDKFAIVGDTTGAAGLNGQYQPMDDETLKTNVVLKDAVNKAYIVTVFEGQTVTLELKDTNLNANEIKDTVISKLSPENQEVAAKATSVKFYENGVEVALGELSRDMFLTMKIVVPNRLFIHSDFRVSQDKNYEITADPSGYIEDAYEANWVDPTPVELKLFDISNLSKESLMDLIVDTAAQLAIANGVGDDVDVEILKKNIRWSFDTALSLKIMVNGEEVTDLSKITLDNGDVTLNIEVEFAPYAKPAE